MFVVLILKVLGSVLFDYDYDLGMLGMYGGKVVNLVV